MSLKSEPLPPVPEATAHLARTVCPKGGLCIWIGDEMSPVFPRRGQPAEAPWRLALVTALQFVEGLSDRVAAEAVRTRIDWNPPKTSLTPSSSISYDVCRCLECA